MDASRVASKLWVGSAPEPRDAPELRALGFRVLVLCAREHQPPAGVFRGMHVVHAPFDDGGAVLPPTAAEQRIARNAARTVAAFVMNGVRTLVTCKAGLNRSGLVAALALHTVTGAPGRWCKEQVQRARHGAAQRKGFEGALFNQHFAAWLDSIGPAQKAA